jgi:ribosome-associated protein
VKKIRRGSLGKKRTTNSNQAGAGGERRRTAAGRIPVRGAAPKTGKGAKAAGKAGKKEKSGGKRPASKLRPRPVAESAPRNERGAAELAETRAFAAEAMAAALDKHALEPVLIDVSGMGSYTDFIGIVSGRSDRQVDAIAENITHVMKARGRLLLGQEGTGSGRWTLLDFGAFVIHVFYHPVREFYDLESLWIEAPRVKLDVPSQSMLGQSDALYGAL